MDNNTNNNGEYIKYLQSDEWAKKRKLCYFLHKGKCYDCGKGVSDGSGNVHHLHYMSIYQEDCEKDLVLVCNTCHLIRHELFEKDCLLSKTLIWVEFYYDRKKRKGSYSYIIKHKGKEYIYTSNELNFNRNELIVDAIKRAVNKALRLSVDQAIIVTTKSFSVSVDLRDKIRVLTKNFIIFRTERTSVNIGRTKKFIKRKQNRSKKQKRLKQNINNRKLGKEKETKNWYISKIRSQIKIEKKLNHTFVVAKLQKDLDKLKKSNLPQHLF